MDCINSLLQAASAEHFFNNYDAVSLSNQLSQVTNLCSYQSRSPCEDSSSMSQTVPNFEDVGGYNDAIQFADDLSAFGEFVIFDSTCRPSLSSGQSSVGKCRHMNRKKV